MLCRAEPSAATRLGINSYRVRLVPTIIPQLINRDWLRTNRTISDFQKVRCGSLHLLGRACDLWPARPRARYRISLTNR